MKKQLLGTVFTAIGLFLLVQNVIGMQKYSLLPLKYKWENDELAKVYKRKDTMYLANTMYLAKGSVVPRCKKVTCKLVPDEKGRYFIKEVVITKKVNLGQVGVVAGTLEHHGKGRTTQMGVFKIREKH